MEKKEFETPEVKVIEIKASSVLCQSECVGADDCTTFSPCVADAQS